VSIVSFWLAVAYAILAITSAFGFFEGTYWLAAMAAAAGWYVAWLNQ
jgi:hypothetical protein